MTVAILADAHIGGPGGPSAPLVEQLAALPDAGCERLLVLGDLFQVWVGDRRYETRDVAEVTAALEALRRRGLRVDYVEGNRDFFIAGSCYEVCFDEVVREVSLEHGGLRYLAVHGDGLDDRDWAYRFWRAVSKSAPSRLAMTHLPNRLARRLVRSTEERLARTNWRHKQRLPERVIRAYAERRLAEGHDVLLLGHFHETRAWRVDGGEVRLLDAWFNSRRIEWLSGEPAVTETGAR